MRVKKPLTKIAPAKTRKPPAKATALTGLARIASQTAMGAAFGLLFAFLATRSPLFGVTPVLDTMQARGFHLADFALTCALAFAIVTTLTGLALGIGEDK
ncbi:MULTISPECIES: hypothetical protein [Rhodopseudomonas]|uniref:Uncharacterized protein n=1 Tax=Rhodopseudomonas palustris TaxID=1076 RepID=A0A0D7EES1_RHOPL|nr:MULTISPECIES: hypothetical protein [Rhodopseudomonas]KIZ39294.1 hypothetical protein OO17_20800 [Rhodopseudomonas palustris]MDF3812524.1 hypothetical protein [Rhodopseudomonas sp. BAL398]WOK17354.1 hypothetical protein RBJ75_25080 [Rhodopseudomonas sp. BAL398]